MNLTDHLAAELAEAIRPVVAAHWPGAAFAVRLERDAPMLVAHVAIAGEMDDLSVVGENEGHLLDRAVMRVEQRAWDRDHGLTRKPKPVNRNAERWEE